MCACFEWYLIVTISDVVLSYWTEEADCIYYRTKVMIIAIHICGNKLKLGVIQIINYNFKLLLIV